LIQITGSHDSAHKKLREVLKNYESFVGDGDSYRTESKYQSEVEPETLADRARRDPNFFESFLGEIAEDDECGAAIINVFARRRKKSIMTANAQTDHHEQIVI